MSDGNTYESLQQTAQYLKLLVPYTPLVGIICGSGMGSLANTLTEKTEVPYETIPYFPTSTVKGHAGALVFGYLEGVPVVCMKGRFHFYEGYPIWRCAMPVRVMKLLGVAFLIATNAAGGINRNYRLGDIMLIKDHLNFLGFAGKNPLQGPNDDRFGPRFPAMNKAYDKDLIIEAKEIGKRLGMEKNIHEGVYACLGGPCYETIAELNMLKTCGADTCGMSTVHEVIAAAHCGMTVFAFSLVTNECIMDYESQNVPKHDEVIEAGKKGEPVLQEFVKEVVKHMSTRNEKCKCLKSK